MIRNLFTVYIEDTLVHDFNYLHRMPSAFVSRTCGFFISHKFLYGNLLRHFNMISEAIFFLLKKY